MTKGCGSFPVSPAVEKFIESARILAEPYEERIAALTADLAEAHKGWKQATDAIATLLGRLGQARSTLARVEAWRDELAANTGGHDADIAAKLTTLLAVAEPLESP